MLYTAPKRVRGHDAPYFTQYMMVRSCDALIGLLAAITVLAGCTDDTRRPHEPAPIASTGAPPFHPPSYPAGRSIDTIASTLASVGGLPVFVVTSRGDSLVAGARFDLLEVHAYDSTTKSWTRVLADSIESGRGFTLRDVTGDGRDDIVVHLAHGGNDPVATNGMHVYTGDGGEIRRVFRSTWMDPTIDSIPGLDERVIAVHRTLWPLFAPRAEALIYIDDIFGYRDGRFRSILSEARTYYQSQARRARIDYEAARDSFALRPVAVDTTRDEMIDDSAAYAHELRIYQTSALFMLHSVKSGNPRDARAFWNSERASLRAALKAEQFDELETFFKRLLENG